MPELMPAPAPSPAPVAAGPARGSKGPSQATESKAEGSSFSDLLNGRAAAPEANGEAAVVTPGQGPEGDRGEDLPLADGKPLPELLAALLALPPEQERSAITVGQGGAAAADTTAAGLEQRLAALLRQFDREAGPRDLRRGVGEIVSEAVAQAREDGASVNTAVRQALASLQQALPREAEFRPAAERLIDRMDQLLQTRASLQPAALTAADVPVAPPAAAIPAPAPGVQGVVVSATSLPGTQVTVPFQQPGWDQAVGERVLWMVSQKLQGAEIRLNPPHLGPIEVRVQLHHDQAQVNFTAQHAVVREALEAALPRLRDMFQSQGVALVNVDVSDRSLAEQRERADAEVPGGRGGLAGIGDEAPAGEDEPLAMIRTLPPDRAIDLFA